MDVESRLTCVLGLVTLGALASACASPVKTYDGLPHPPAELAYISLAFLGPPLSVSRIDGKRLWETSQVRTYAAVEPGVHEVVLAPRPDAVRQAGPALFPVPAVTIRREYSAGLVYDWYRTESRGADGYAQSFWMAPSTDPTDHGGFGVRWNARRKSMSSEGFRVSPRARPTPVYPSSAGWQLDSAVRELRDRPRATDE